MGSTNYSYKNRYLFDGTLRLDGSSLFGTDKKFTPFWSLGTGWNLHEEQFVRQFRKISSLRLRATMGQLGNQNLSSANSSSIYAYQLGGNVFGPGVFVSALGNPNIEWQKTLNTNLAVDLNLFDSRLVTKWEVYQKYTNPMIVAISQAPSTGSSTFPMSVGSLTYSGFEFDVAYAIIRTRNLSWRMRVMGSTLRGVYSGFSNKLENMNTEAQNNNQLNRYRDGYGPKTLWAVRSMGIDPMTGREMFLTKNNERTFLFDPGDVEAVGSGEPKVMGTINNTFTFKQLTLSAVFRYGIQESKFNSVLFSKVENIGKDQVVNNQDLRALKDRWTTIGQISQFRSIGITEATPMSDRFIQTESFLSAESIGITWRMNRDGWIKNLGLSRLDITGTFTGTSGVFRLSNILLERGTSYPEATTISISVNAAF
jgi:hypothetical protein